MPSPRLIRNRGQPTKTKTKPNGVRGRMNLPPKTDDECNEELNIPYIYETSFNSKFYNSLNIVDY